MVVVGGGGECSRCEEEEEEVCMDTGWRVLPQQIFVAGARLRVGWGSGEASMASMGGFFVGEKVG